MESSQDGLTLNKGAFKRIPHHKKPVYVFEWLQYLDKSLVVAQKWVLAAIITTMGPVEGNTTSISTMRSSLLCACAIMQSHYDPLVQVEATGL